MSFSNKKPKACCPAGAETMEKTMKQKIRDILGKHGGLPVAVDTLADDADLYAAIRWNAGMGSTGERAKRS